MELAANNVYKLFYSMAKIFNREIEAKAKNSYANILHLRHIRIDSRPYSVDKSERRRIAKGVEKVETGNTKLCSKKIIN